MNEQIENPRNNTRMLLSAGLLLFTSTIFSTLPGLATSHRESDGNAQRTSHRESENLCACRWWHIGKRGLMQQRADCPDDGWPTCVRPNGTHSCASSVSAAYDVLTHVVVLAAHYSCLLCSTPTKNVREHASKLQQWFPARRWAAVVVDNNSSDAAAQRMAWACGNASGFVYTRNEEQPTFGYELGAWRWAVRRILPTLAMAADAVVYLLQDTAFLTGPPLPHPPPPGFRVASLSSFNGSLPLMGVPSRACLTSCMPPTNCAIHALASLSPLRQRLTTDPLH